MDSHGKNNQSNSAASKGTENQSNSHRAGRGKQKNQEKMQLSNRKQGRSTQGAARKGKKQAPGTQLSRKRTQPPPAEAVTVRQEITNGPYNAGSFTGRPQSLAVAAPHPSTVDSQSPADIPSNMETAERDAPAMDSFPPPTQSDYATLEKQDKIDSTVLASELSSPKTSHNAQENTLPSDLPEKSESGIQSGITAEGDAKAKKAKAPRTFGEIMDDVGGQEPKSGSLIDRYVGLVLELPLVKDMNVDLIPHFFASINEQIEEVWTPFLSKTAINVDPNKTGIERMIADEIRKCCENVMEDCGLPVEALQGTFRDFCESKNEEVIKKYLHTCSRVEPATPAQKGMPPTRKITDQELACVSYAYLTLELRMAYPSDYKLLVKVDRAIAEYFGKTSLREQAGKTVGNVLSSRQYSQKRIGDLTYLYSGTTECLRKKSVRIQELEDTAEQLRDRNAELADELSKWKGSHADSVRRIEELEAECAMLRKEREEANNLLEYERNRFQLQIQSKEEGLAEQLSEEIAIEIQSIRETAEYVDKDNRYLIYRRLQRIDDILKEFGGRADA